MQTNAGSSSIRS